MLKLSEAMPGGWGPSGKTILRYDTGSKVNEWHASTSKAIFKKLVRTSLLYKSCFPGCSKIRTCWERKQIICKTIHADVSEAPFGGEGTMGSTSGWTPGPSTCRVSAVTAGKISTRCHRSMGFEIKGSVPSNEPLYKCNILFPSSRLCRSYRARAWWLFDVNTAVICFHILIERWTYLKF